MSSEMSDFLLEKISKRFNKWQSERNISNPVNGSERELSTEFSHGLLTAWERDKEKIQSKIEVSKNDITQMQIILGIIDEEAAEAVTKLEKTT